MPKDINLVIIIAICGLIGTTVRVLHEKQTKPLPLVRICYIYACSAAILMAIWFAPPAFGWDQSRVFLSIIGGIISVDVVELVITRGSEWIGKLINKKLDIKNDKKE